MKKSNRVETLLWRLGANYSYTGFTYILSAIELIQEDRQVLQYITKGVYLPVAMQYKTTDKCVERDIRTVVEAIWKYGNHGLLEKIAGRKLADRPNNRNFLEILARYVQEDF